MKTLVLFKQTCLAEKGRGEENNFDCTIAHEFSESICLCVLMLVCVSIEGSGAWLRYEESWTKAHGLACALSLDKQNSR